MQGDSGSIPGQGTSHMPQLKITHATTKTQYSQKKEEKKRIKGVRKIGQEVDTKPEEMKVGSQKTA